MDNKDQTNEYRSERKERLAKAAKKKSNKKHDSTDVIAGIIKAIAIIAAIAIVCGVAYAYGVPQSLIPALKVDGRTYSMAEYNYYYSRAFIEEANLAYTYQSQMGFNITGFDYTKDPSEQTTKDDDGNTITFDQKFRNSVKSTLENYNYYLKLAKEQNVTLSEESKQSMEDEIQELATAAANYSLSTTRYISRSFGNGMTEKKLRKLLEDQYLVQQMIESKQDQLKESVTDDQINAAYEEDPGKYQSVDIRLLGIKIQDDTATETVSTSAPTESSADETTTAAETTTTAETTTAAETTTTAETTTAAEATSAENTSAESESGESTSEETTAAPSKAELLANEMLSKITDEASFVELCKEYCDEDQKANFEDESASLAKNLNRDTIKSQVSEEVAEWLFSPDRVVGDKRVAVAGDYAYVMMITKTAYRDEDPLASVRHILISYDDIAKELSETDTESTTEGSVEEATEAEGTTAAEEVPSEEAVSTSQATTEETTAAQENETTAAAETTAPSKETETEDTASGEENVAESDGKYSKEVIQAAKEKAMSILEEYKEGEQTEDAFAALAEQYSSDKASLEEGGTTSGGLYEDVQKGKMVAPFENWVYDESRQVGDVDIIQTSYGWHIMYFVSKHDDPVWKETIVSSIVDELLKTEQEAVTAESENTAEDTIFTNLAGNQALKMIKKNYSGASTTES